MKNLNIDWLAVGSKFNTSTIQKKTLVNIFKKLEWKTKGEQVDLTRGEGIKHIINSFQLQNIVIGWAIKEDVLAVKAKFSQGVVSFLVIDQGNVLTPVMTVKDWQ